MLLRLITTQLIITALSVIGTANAAEIGTMDSSENPINLPYMPSKNIKAHSCEFYVNGFGDGTEHVYAAVGGNLYEAWIRVNLNQLLNNFAKVLNVGGFFRYTEQLSENPEPVLRETLVTGSPVPSETGYFRVDFRYNWHNMNKETSRTVHNFAFFADVEDQAGAVTRFWLTHGSRDFTITEVFDNFPLTNIISSGPGLRTMRYIENFSGSPLFNQRRICAGIY
jgi:hypothetical protein